MHLHGHHHHDHDHPRGSHAHSRSAVDHASHGAAADRSTANLRLAFLLNLAFTLIELVGGYWTGSLAIAADAVHDLGDSLSLGVAWWLGRLSGRPSDAAFSYGYRRWSLAGALVTGLVLVGGSVAIVYGAALRLLSDQPVAPYAPGMIGFALLGIAVNGLAAWRLHRDTSLNARMVSWHLLEDVLGWVAVGLTAGLILIWEEAAILDPILSAVIALWVLYNVARNLRRTGAILMQASPEGADLAAFEHAVAAMPGVRSMHHTHGWSLDGVYHILTTHVVIDDGLSAVQMMALKQAVKKAAVEQRFDHTTVELEFAGEHCEMRPSAEH